ncbi:hypothetical protein WJX72_004835 [[Myrmecia] bisecta]|uniref:Purple acid phosphatase n=1 Tax=[Myrmecia] bisecta TaxID=41462 RepID=A0AAW1R6H2_9CHLO
MAAPQQHLLVLSLAWLCLLVITPLAVAGRGLTLASSGQACQPTQVHLAVTGNPTEMRVMWKTAGKGCHADVQCWLDNKIAADDNAAKALHASSESSYSSADMCSAPATDFAFEPPSLHTAVITELVPGERYRYQIGLDGSVSSFRAAPASSPDRGFRFLVYGDMGESEHKAAKSPGARATAKAATAEVLDGGAELVLHIGDISYANGDPDIWDTFMDYITPYAAAAPYMIGIGNHEYDYRTGKEKKHKHDHKLASAADPSGEAHPYDPDWGNYGNDSGGECGNDSGGECGVAVSKRFIMPGASSDADALPGADNHHHSRGAPAQNSPFWYSFDYGSVHFTIISTEHDLTKGSEQHEWLAADLAGVDRCQTPWLLVGMHRPMYVVYPHKSNRIVGEHLRSQLEDVFEAHAVDMVLSGHVHAYARTCNVYNGECVADADGGATHITLGCGGRKLSRVEHDQSSWLEYAEAEYGYGRVTVHDGNSLLFEFVGSEDGNTRDSLLLHNSRADARTCNGASPVVQQ